jgi:hypothetical protein
MSVIENFNDLSAEELKQFAQNLLDKINEESIFTSEVNFVLNAYNEPETNLAGNLIFWADSPEDGDGITVERNASWQAYDEDDMATSEDIDFDNSLDEDAKSSFKTLVAEIDGYRVTLFVSDTDEIEKLDVDVTDWTTEEGGIGSYEYWGTPGYDSYTYFEVEGVISYNCFVCVEFEVEPIK